ncbi:Chain length determinant protein [Enterobacter cloacae]|nr:Chain length determinant protein [Enterobacter cloacae]CAH3280563.1 Chain length determinant protein [Enterobacter cloacae]
MTHNNDNLVTRNNDPEQIDLLDLVLQLWRGKWVIGAFVAAFIVLAVVYITVAKEGANKQVISSQADSLIKISRIWADFFPANTSNQPI